MPTSLKAAAGAQTRSDWCRGPATTSTQSDHTGTLHLNLNSVSEQLSNACLPKKYLSFESKYLAKS